MTLTLDLQFLRRRTAEFCAQATPEGAKIKTLRHVLGLSEAGAERIASGRMLTLARHYGRDFLDFVFADIEATASDREALAGRYIKAARAERVEASNAATNENRARDGLADRRLGRDGQLAAGSAWRSSSRLISIRRSPSCLGDLGCAHLRDRLSRFTGRITRPDRAVAFAKADPLKRTGIAVRDGSSWRLEHVALANGLTNQGMVGRRISDLVDREYAELLTKSFDETAASPEPIVTDVAGAVMTADGDLVLTHSRIARAVMGNVLMACFTPLAQRQATG